MIPIDANLLAHEFQRHWWVAAHGLLHPAASDFYPLIPDLESDEGAEDDSTQASKRNSLQEKTVA
jgi:hypothetical protein